MPPKAEVAAPRAGLRGNVQAARAVGRLDGGAPKAKPKPKPKVRPKSAMPPPAIVVTEEDALQASPNPAKTSVVTDDTHGMAGFSSAPRMSKGAFSTAESQVHVDSDDEITLIAAPAMSNVRSNRRSYLSSDEDEQSGVGCSPWSEGLTTPVTPETLDADLSDQVPPHPRPKNVPLVSRRQAGEEREIGYKFTPHPAKSSTTPAPRNLRRPSYFSESSGDDKDDVASSSTQDVTGNTRRMVPQKGQGARQQDAMRKMASASNLPLNSRSPSDQDDNDEEEMSVQATQSWLHPGEAAKEVQRLVNEGKLQLHKSDSRFIDSDNEGTQPGTQPPTPLANLQVRDSETLGIAQPDSSISTVSPVDSPARKCQAQLTFQGHQVAALCAQLQALEEQQELVKGGLTRFLELGNNERIVERSRCQAMLAELDKLLENERQHVEEESRELEERLRRQRKACEGRWLVEIEGVRSEVKRLSTQAAEAASAAVEAARSSSTLSQCRKSLLEAPRTSIVGLTHQGRKSRQVSFDNGGQQSPPASSRPGNASLRKLTFEIPGENGSAQCVPTAVAPNGLRFSVLDERAHIATYISNRIGATALALAAKRPSVVEERAHIAKYITNRIGTIALALAAKAGQSLDEQLSVAPSEPELRRVSSTLDPPAQPSALPGNSARLPAHSGQAEQQGHEELTAAPGVSLEHRKSTSALPQWTVNVCPVAERLSPMDKRSTASFDSDSSPAKPTSALSPLQKSDHAADDLVMPPVEPLAQRMSLCTSEPSEAAHQVHDATEQAHVRFASESQELVSAPQKEPHTVATPQTQSTSFRDRISLHELEAEEEEELDADTGRNPASTRRGTAFIRPMRDLGAKTDENDIAGSDSDEDSDSGDDIKETNSTEECDTLSQRSNPHNSPLEEETCAMDAEASSPSASGKHVSNDSCHASATVQAGEVLDVSPLHAAVAADEVSAESKPVDTEATAPATTAAAVVANATDFWMARPFSLPPPTRSATQPASRQPPGRKMPLPVTEVLSQNEEVSFSGLATQTTAIPTAAAIDVGQEVLTRSAETINLDMPSPRNSVPTTPAEQRRRPLLGPLLGGRAISPPRPVAPAAAPAGNVQQEEAQLLAHSHQLPSPPLTHPRHLPQPQVQTTHCPQHMQRHVAMPPTEPVAAANPVTMSLPRPVLISEFNPHPEATTAGCPRLQLGTPRLLAPSTSPPSPSLPCKQSCSSTTTDELQFEQLEQQQQQQKQQQQKQPLGVGGNNPATRPMVLPRPQGVQPAQKLDPARHLTTTETCGPCVEAPRLPPGRMTVLEEQVAALLQEVRVQARAAVVNYK